MRLLKKSKQKQGEMQNEIISDRSNREIRHQSYGDSIEDCTGRAIGRQCPQS